MLWVVSPVDHENVYNEKGSTTDKITVSSSQMVSLGTIVKTNSGGKFSTTIQLGLKELVSGGLLEIIRTLYEPSSVLSGTVAIMKPLFQYGTMPMSMGFENVSSKQNGSINSDNCAVKTFPKL